MRRALVLVGSDRIAATVVDDAATCPKFVANWRGEHHSQLGQLLQANLHLFSPRQQRAVLVGVPLADAVAANCSGSRGNDSAGGSAATAAGSGGVGPFLVAASSAAVAVAAGAFAADAAAIAAEACKTLCG